MRIIYWAPFFWPDIGGIEHIGGMLVRDMQRRGHEVRVVTSHGNTERADEEIHDGVRIHRFRFRKALDARDPALLFEVQRAVAALRRAFAADLIHVNCPDPAVVFQLRTRASDDARIVVTLHLDPSELPRERSGLMKATLDSADWITTVSDDQLDTLVAAYPGLSGKASSLPNGIIETSVAPTPLPFDPPTLLCLGRVAAQKRFDLAVRAFAQIASRHAQVRLTIAGDGPDREALTRLAAELGVADRVDFIGWVPPEMVPAVMNQATIVMMPSQMEGLPLVALEAAQMARPVVATRAGGLTEVVVDGKTGSLVDIGDVDGLAAAALAMLENPARSGEMGRAARERVRAMFGWERYADSYEKLYNQLATESLHVS